MTIDDIADRVTGKASPGERFREEWLEGLPVGQWPSYIDENAELVDDGILIGDTGLTSADFAYETGEFYRRGLAAATGVDPAETSLPLGDRSASDVGLVAWTFNRLRREVRRSERTGFENPSRAIEAGINRALIESLETGRLDAGDLETIRLPADATASTLVSEVFCRPRSETYVDLLLETVRGSATSGLLDRIEEPRMVTPLWDHQREALEAWLEHGCRGYVDMATATGKTVLGLAAVAHHFGELHPDDRDLVETDRRPAGDGRATVVVVAHRELILDQWKREFDVHLNVPEQSTTRSGDHTVEFEWGDVHFRTPNRLVESGVPDADLVVLDETHHYLGSSGFGTILDEVDGHLLALSGSLDDANARTMERRDVPKLFEFSLRDGQRAGVVPRCDWDVVLTPYEDQSRLAEVTAECRQGVERYADGVEPPNDIDAERSELTFETLSEARSLAQSSVGRELKERDNRFREFFSAVMARRMTRYNLSPALSTVVRLVLDRVDRHKCVVLLETGDEIERVTRELEAELGEDYEPLVTVLDSEADLSTVERFDRDRDRGAIVGVARTLGEGVDIETADVCINRGRGRLSRSLVQRMGRVLRNPDGDKRAEFLHVTGVPTHEDATLAHEDGVNLLETASQLLAWGEGFRARPVFAVDAEAGISEEDLADLEAAGVDAIDAWTPAHYEWPADDAVRAHLESLCERVRERDGSGLLAVERPTHDGPAPAGTDGIRFVEASVRSYASETAEFPAPEVVPDAERGRTVRLNPALAAVLSAGADESSLAAAAHAAVAEAVVGDLETAVERSGLDLGPDAVRSRLDPLVRGGVDD